MSTPLKQIREAQMKRFDKEFYSEDLQTCLWHRNQDLKSFLEASLKEYGELVKEDTIGNIGARLLANHSPQAVLDAYFDAANCELE